MERCHGHTLNPDSYVLCGIPPSGPNTTVLLPPRGVGHWPLAQGCEYDGDFWELASERQVVLLCQQWGK